MAHHCYNISSKGVVLAAGVMTQQLAPQTHYTLRHNAAKNLICFNSYISSVMNLSKLDFKSAVADKNT